MPFIFRSSSRYFALSSLVQESRGLKEIPKGTHSGKQEAYLPEIAVHKTIDKTSKAKPLAIFNVTNTTKGGCLSPSSLSSAQCSIFCYISHRITRPTGRGQNFTRGTPSNIRAKESVVCQ